MITYKEEKYRKVYVYLEKKLVGKINCMPDSKFQYIPLGVTSKNGGEIFDSLIACKQSLEAE